MRIGTNIIVAGLHNPVRLAEDATALSLLTDNRFELGVGLGYRELEFSGFGRSVKNRPSLLEDAIAIIRQAWTGSADGYEGQTAFASRAARHPGTRGRSATSGRRAVTRRHRPRRPRR